MKTSVGFVTVSANEHRHNYYEIIFYRKGTGKFHFSGKSLPISPGKFVIVPPETVHASKYTDAAETIYIKGDFKHIFSLSAPAEVFDDDEKSGSFLAEMMLKNKFSPPEYLDSLANALAHFLMQDIRTEKSTSSVLHSIVAEISDNFFDSNINVNEILKKSGYAEDYIRAQFKLFTGKTPIEFLTEARINHACYLIEIYGDSVALTEIAEKCGYTDYVYFSRRFKQLMGVSPKNYMKI